MRRSASQACLLTYVGTVLLIIGFYPGTGNLLDPYRWLHGIWHIWMFIGAGLVVYGLETLRSIARRHRRMTT